MKHILYSIVKMTVIFLISIPTTVIGGSIVSSLVSGKTPSEAVVILGENLDLLLGRVETVERGHADLATTTNSLIATTTVLRAEHASLQTQQNSLADTQNSLNTAQLLLKKQQDAIDLQTKILLDSQARLADEQAKAVARETALQQKTQQNTQNIESIQAAASTPPVQSASISLRTYAYGPKPFSPGDDVRLIGIRIHNTGDAPIMSIDLGFSISGVCPFANLRVESGNGSTIASSNSCAQAGNFILNVTIPQGETRDYVVMGRVVKSTGGETRFSVGAISNIPNITGLPLDGDLILIADSSALPQ